VKIFERYLPSFLKEENIASSSRDANKPSTFEHWFGHVFLHPQHTHGCQHHYHGQILHQFEGSPCNPYIGFLLHQISSEKIETGKNAAISQIKV
jgi:hypothetical protein